ncbi:DUF4845 domain-containing protein [Kinneretia aquatilis]|jgi:hypothetical protein|uniref:DUF4845 domain-containing protein n=1 Tax=Kinneretia aquatilis TaxID=2070761 RepID=UPI0014952A1E|nr:DUF4845 domain-containing protein [Paucibacter aquatile]WIV96654.1 DUF4845 domain-containing protein [Paucibacter aquatile]
MLRRQSKPGQRCHSGAQARSQRGISLLGLLFWGVLLAFGGVVIARVIPTVLEFYTIQRVVDRIAAANPATVPAVRAEFERAQQVEYSMVSISSQDLVISKDNEKLQISFAYDKQVDLAGPVYLLIKYQGKSR